MLKKVDPLDIIIKPEYTEIYFDSESGVKTMANSIKVVLPDGRIVDISDLVDSYMKHS